MVDQIVSKLIEVVKKKNKAGVTVKPFQVVLPWQHIGQSSFLYTLV